MASTASESSELCSPAGSILVTPFRGETRPVPLRCFADSTSLETALQDGPQDFEQTLARPPALLPSKDDPDDWILGDTLDPATIRLTLDDFDSPELLIPGLHTSWSRSESQDSVEMGDLGHQEELDEAPTDAPFHKWMRRLRRRAGRRQYTSSIDETLHRSASMGALCQEASKTTSHHRQSSSGSSFGFVEAVKTASVSLASGSVFNRSRRNSLRSSRTQAHTDRSSRASLSSHRCSEDSNGLDKPRVLDKAAVERSLQRRRILEELISTEEGYIGDVRFLMNVYVTILVSLPTMPQGLRSSINRNLADVVDLHEELLGELHRAVPHSEYTQLDLASRAKDRGHGHRRIRSLNAVPEDDEGMSWLETVPGMVADPNVAADVAKVFTNKMNRFFVYEEYGAKYEMMIKDIASAHRTMPQWETYQRGLETLASSVGPRSSHGDKSKKSLTIGDLLVKPIQRVCKYPLLFAELLKYTPAADSPYAHMEIESALVRLREATSQINRATDDARVKTVLEKTWLLQDRLVFPESKLDAASRNRIRSFGLIQLCGVLHACWQSKDGIQGQYFVTLLYKNWLCLASASRVDQIYTLQACIPLGQVKVEAVDNGRGLQCHTTPFSWKIVFECDYQLYEMMLTACTPKEEDEWRSRLDLSPVMNLQEQEASDLYSSLFLNVRSLGTVFGKQGTIARKISIDRATTVSPRSPICNVVVRNTSVEKDALASAHATINRSQSLLATKGRVPVLAPSRADRARLEALLSDVWTREILPFPGMTARARNEHLIRTSAHSMIRKLSVTSITSTFTKRSASLASVTRGGSDEESGAEDETFVLKTPATPTEPPPPPPPPSVDNRHDTILVSNKSRLSIIEDDSDRTPSTLRARSVIQPSCTVGSAENSRSPRRRMRITKSPSAWQLGERASGLASHAVPPLPSTPTAGALRARSINGPQLKRDSSLLSGKSVRSAYSAVNSGGRGLRKKHAGDDADHGRGKFQERPPSGSATPPPSASPSKTSANRWSRVDILRRGAVAQGLRGIFR